LEAGWLSNLAGKAESALIKAGASPEDAKSRAEALAALKPKTVLDLMATPDGREVWKAKGYMAQMAFDLKPGSRSLSVLNGYLKSKGKPEVAFDEEAAGKAREDREVRAEAAKPKPIEADPKAMAEIDAKARKKAEESGLGRIFANLEVKEREFRDTHSAGNDPRMQAMAADPVETRRAVYNSMIFDALRARHAARMQAPQYEKTRSEWEAKAAKAGIDTTQAATEARWFSFAATNPDPVKSIGQAYQAAIDQIQKERGGNG
jgi:hypothetical protein